MKRRKVEEDEYHWLSLVQVMVEAEQVEVVLLYHSPVPPVHSIAMVASVRWEGVGEHDQSYPHPQQHQEEVEGSPHR